MRLRPDAEVRALYLVGGRFDGVGLVDLNH